MLGNPLFTKFTRVAVTDGLVIDKDGYDGLKVDLESPSYTWRDLEGPISPRETGAGKPTLTTYVSNIKDWAFAADDVVDLKYHIPHDWVKDTQFYLHAHWSHTGTSISGSLVLSYRWIYAKGHNQANFSAQDVLTQTISTPDIATIPRYRHVIDEIVFSDPAPSGGQIDTDVLEPDGLLLVNLTPTTIPTIGGGGALFIHYIDIHYQSTNIGTKQKSPDFWT